MKGKILADRYEILEQIGEGGMAKVYKAKCKLLDRYVAIKVLKDEFAGDNEFVKKFRMESQAAASLTHPNILNVYDVGEEIIDGKQIHYIVMEYIRGETLKAYMDRKGKLESQEALEFACQIAEALKDAHDNHIVHRDIKPENIMITQDGRIKVTDFGIARAVTSATVTVTSKALGSVHYLSPEQARGGYIDEKSDIYSLGIVMFEMLVGRTPYDGDTPVAIAIKHIQEDIPAPSGLEATISKDVESIIQKATARQQIDRYQSVDELIKDIEAAKAGMGIAYTNTKEDEDDSATRIIPKIDDELIEKEGSKKSKINEDQVKEEEEESKSGQWKVTILAILLAFAVVSGGFFAVMNFRGRTNGNEDIEVPRFIGLSLEDAEEKASDLGLKIKVKSTDRNPDFEVGEIIKQNPQEGMKVKEGFEVEVIVNEDEELVRVPSVVNKTLEEAERILIEEGFELGQVSKKPSDVTPEGYVLRQEPEGYIYLELGSKINLVVSEGEKLTPVYMPNVVNQNVIDAKNILVNLGLKVNTQEEYSSDFDKDTVMWQSYKTGEELDPGSTVDLYISIGPREDNTNNQTPNEETPKEGNVYFSLIPFTDRESTEIVIIRNQDGYTNEVYRKTHQASEGEVDIVLKGKTGAEFQVLFDDIYQFTRIKED